MGKHENLCGACFGNLTVVSYAGTNKNRQALWDVRCSCGGTATVAASKLKGGRAKSCGCGAANASPNMEGRRYGNLTVIEFAGVNKSRAKTWKCLCICGKSVTVSGVKLRVGHTKSCGCLVAEKAATLNLTHGLSSIPEYQVWKGMLQRTLNTNHTSYKNYGGRGIRVCDRWLRFENFFADMGTRPEGKFSVERADNNGNYEPENCYWADYFEQSRNKRQRKDR